jgi:SAM-dependent methyltransferase
MDELAREYVLSFYDKTLRMFGDRPEALRWTSGGQELHYEALLDIADSIHGKKVLDFGCGKGDFCRFLKQRDIQVDYTGLDINEKLIGMAREKNPGTRFSVFDIEQDTLGEDFDYIFLCGVFNLNVQGIDGVIRSALKKLFGRCRIGLAFNAPSAHNPKKDFELHYVSPEDLFSFAMRNLSPFVSIRHDRMPYDFTMFVYREIRSFY